VLLQSRAPDLGISGIALQDLVAAHDPVFYFVDPDQPPELCRLVCLALSQGLAVGLEQAKSLIS
jgi:hypothetical protein